MLFRDFFVSYCKESTHFKLQYQLELIKTPIADEQVLQDFMAKHMKVDSSFAENRPEWVLYIFENYQIDKSALVIKIHHAYADGISLQSFIAYLEGYTSFQLAWLL
jgi:NRPS condensation-like uncharacterized protein